MIFFLDNKITYIQRQLLLAVVSGSLIYVALSSATNQWMFVYLIASGFLSFITVMEDLIDVCAKKCEDILYFRNSYLSKFVFASSLAMLVVSFFFSFYDVLGASLVMVFYYVYATKGKHDEDFISS